MHVRLDKATPRQVLLVRPCFKFNTVSVRSSCLLDKRVRPASSSVTQWGGVKQRVRLDKLDESSEFNMAWPGLAHVYTDVSGCCDE